MLCQKGFLGSTPLALPSKVSLTLCKASLLWLGLSAGQLLCPGCDLIKACCCQWPVVASTRDGHHRPPATTTNSQLKTSFCPLPLNCELPSAPCNIYIPSQLFVSDFRSNDRWQQDQKKENRLLATSQRGRRGETSK